MLSFCNMQIRHVMELSNDVADEVWTTELPATKDSPREGYGIYEKVKIHLINPKQDIENHMKEFFNGSKYNLFLRRTEFSLFCMSWYKECVARGLISGDSVNIIEWVSCYETNFSNYYRGLLKQENSLGYFDSLAINDLFIENPESGEYSIYWDFSELNIIPEISWILADYLKTGNKLWEKYLTEYIRGVIRNTNFKLNMLPYAKNLFKFPISLAEKVRINQINWDKENAWLYMHNIFDEDFYTNVVYIQRLLDKLTTANN